jgi:hypothetical protein
MSTATLRESLDTVFTDADWVLDIAFCVGSEATPDDLDGYVHTLTLKRRTPRLTTAAEPIELSSADGTLQYTAPNLVGPRVLSAQLATWVEGIYDLEQTWLRPDGVIEVVLVSTVSVIKGLSLGGSFAGLSLPANGRSLTVVRSPGQARIIRTARGPSGWNGWTPVLSVDDATAPPKRLMKVIDWLGGGGEKPAVGSWVAVGGLTANSSTASDFGGAATAATIAATTAAVAATSAATAATADSVAKTALAVTATTNANAATTAATAATADSVTKTALAVTATTNANAATTAATAATADSVTKTALAVTATTNANAATTAATAATADSVAKTALAVTATTNANAATAASTTQTAACAVATAAAVAAVEGATAQLIVSVSAPRYLTAADHGKLLAFVGDRPALLYVPAGLLAGFQAEIMKGGTANVFVHALPGAAVGGVAGKTGLTTQYASQRLRQISTNNYAVSDGESAAVPPSINFPDFRNARASGLALFWFA